MAEYGSTSVKFNPSTTQNTNNTTVNPFSGKQDFRFSVFTMAGAKQPQPQQAATSAFCLSA